MRLFIFVMFFVFSFNSLADRESTVGGGGENIHYERAKYFYNACIERFLTENSDSELSDAEDECRIIIDDLVEEGLITEDDADGLVEELRKKYPGTRDGSNVIKFPGSVDEPESGDSSGGAGELLFQGYDIVEPVFTTSIEECDRGGTVGLICSYDDSGELVASTTSNLQSALSVLKNSGLEITPEGVLVAGGVVSTIALVARYARPLNPLGAFALGLGVAPVAASDYCSMYSSDEGFEYFVNELSNEEQIQEFGVCPELSQKVVDFAIQVQEAQ